MDAQKSNTQETVRRFLGERFLFDAEAAIDPARSLIETGVLDSTGVMELVVFLEKCFAIKIADADLVPENLDGLARIASFVDRKRGGVAGASGAAAATSAAASYAAAQPVRHTGARQV